MSAGYLSQSSRYDTMLETLWDQHLSACGHIRILVVAYLPRQPEESISRISSALTVPATPISVCVMGHQSRSRTLIPAEERLVSEECLNPADNLTTVVF